MQKPRQTLLTGFGPFGRVVNNPSERLLRHFETEEVAGHELTTCLLPTSFAVAPERVRAALEIGGRGGQPFDTVLLLGVANGSPHWRVERVGRNQDEAITDVDGFTPPSRVIVPDAPETLPVSFPVEAIVAALERAGLPVIASDSAGGFLCNHVLYTTLHRLQSANSPARVGFLHVPADEQTYATGLTTAPVFPFAQHIEAARATLNVLAAGDSRDLRPESLSENKTADH